jgi:hypothetical protein
VQLWLVSHSVYGQCADTLYAHLDASVRSL